MLTDAILRNDISLACFQSHEERYLASFRWHTDELHAFGRKCGKGGVFLMKNRTAQSIGFITFALAPQRNALTMNTGGTTGKYRNMGFGIPLLDSFYSLLFVMGVDEMEIISGVDNPYVLMLIHTRYGFGPEAQRAENAMMIGNSDNGDTQSFPVHFLGDAARRRIAHDAAEAPPDPFGPKYRVVEKVGRMPVDSCTVYVGETYHIDDREKLYRRVLNFLPGCHHHPEADEPARRIIWKSRTLSRAQAFLAMK